MRGSAGLLIMFLLGLLVIAFLFAATKFIVPNPQTIQEDKKIQQDAQDAVNQIQQKSIENQSVELD